MYVVDGKDYPMKKIIVAKVLDISARATGWPPGYDILIAHVDRNCKKCKKGMDIKIVPIPIANKIPKHNTKALHIVACNYMKSFCIMFRNFISYWDRNYFNIHSFFTFFTISIYMSD